MTTLVTRGTKTSTLTHNELDANFKRVAQTKAASYTVAESDNRDVIELSAVATITLPDAATIVAAADTGDFEVTLKNISGVDCTITCTTVTDTIEGVTTDHTLLDDGAVTLKVNQAANGYNIVSGAASIFTSPTITSPTITNPTINGESGYGIVVLDSPEQLTTTNSPSAWLQYDMSAGGTEAAAAATAGATKAILRVYLSINNTSGTTQDAWVIVQKNGLGGGTGFEKRAVYLENSSSSTNERQQARNDIIVNLDSNSDFEYQTDTATFATSGIAIYLIGYYV